MKSSNLTPNQRNAIMERIISHYYDETGMYINSVSEVTVIATGKARIDLENGLSFTITVDNN